MEGFADLLVRPKSNIECSIILKTCYICNILLTVSAGKTNLTGSATPNGGVILSTSLLTKPDIELNLKNKEASSPVGIPLENFRNKVAECDDPIDQAIDEVYDRRDSMDDPKILTHLGKTLKFNSAILSAYSKIVHFDLIVPRKTHPYEPWKKFVNTNLFLFNPNGETKESLIKSWLPPPIHSSDSIATCSHKIGLSIHKSSNSWASDILKLDQTSDPENEIYSTHKDG